MPYSAKSDDSGTINQFTRRKEVIITTGGTSTPADYQVKLTITYESEMQADFDDLRFNTLSGGYIDYWIESYTASTTATVWIELPDAITDPGSDYIQMYYGNTGLSDGGNLADTFVFGDNFLGSSLDTEKWTSSGTIGVSDSEVTINEDDSIKSIDTFGYGYSVKAKSKADEQDTVFVRFGDNFAVGVGNALELYNSDYSNLDNFDSCSCSKILTGTPTANLIDDQLDFRNTYRKYEIIRTSTEAKYYQDGNLLHTYDNSGNWPAGNLSVGAITWDSSQASILTIDWIFVRKYLANEPTPSCGTAQHQRRVPQFIG